MSDLNASQVRMVSTIAAHKGSGVEMVKMVYNAISDYWNVDSHSAENIQFMVNELHTQKMTRYLKSVLSILDAFLFLDVVKAKDAYIVTNRKGVNKAQKLKAQNDLIAYEWVTLTSLLDFGSEKKEDKKKAPKPGLSFQDAVRNELAKGMTIEQLMDILIQVCSEEIENGQKLAA